jgi:hypothetical protein
MRKNNRDAYVFSRRNYNSFPPLLKYNIVCYNNNNYGNIEKLYRSDFRKTQKEETPTIVKRNKEHKEPKKDKSLFIQAAALCAQSNKYKWCIDRRCSSHMRGDRTKFITLKNNEASVTFWDNDTSKIVGKGILSLDNRRDKVENVLCVEY